jgi:hypothetical protein
MAVMCLIMIGSNIRWIGTDPALKILYLINICLLTFLLLTQTTAIVAQVITLRQIANDMQSLETGENDSANTVCRESSSTPTRPV